MKKLLKLLSVFAAVVLFSATFAAGLCTVDTNKAFALTDYSAMTGVAPSGSGTAGDPYRITSVENFKWLDDNLAATASGHFVLENDVDFSDVEGFYPIGRNKTVVFAGTFDGNGHALLNVNVTVSDSDTGAGLFGKVQNASFKNLTLKNVNAEAPGSLSAGYRVSNVGSLAGVAIGSSFDNVTVDGGTVSGKNNVGGLVGNANDCVLRYIRTDNTVNVSYGNLSSPGFAGGIVGDYMLDMTNRTMEYCYSLSEVKGSDSFKNHLGGLLGKLELNEFEENGRRVTRKFDFNFCYFAGVIDYSVDSEGATTDVFGSFTSNNLVDSNVGFSKCLYSSENKNAGDVIHPYQNGTSLTSSQAKGLTRAQLKNPAEVNKYGWNFNGQWIIDLSKADSDVFGSYPDFLSKYEGSYVTVYFVEVELGGKENGDSDLLNYKGGMKFVKGNKIDLSFAVPTGRKLGEFTVGGEDKLAEVTDSSYTMTVPDADVTVKFGFKPKQYSVVISNSCEGVINVGGRVDGDENDFVKDYGSVVEFTVKPDKYYEFLKITVTDGAGKDVKYNEISRGETYSFTVRSDVTVSVEWQKKTAYLAVILNSNDYGSIETSLDGGAFKVLTGRNNLVECGTEVLVRTKASSDAYRLFKWQYSTNAGTTWVDDVLYDNLKGDKASGAYYENGYYYYSKAIPDGINKSEYLVRAFYEDVRTFNLKIGSLEGGTFKINASNKFAVVSAIDGVEQAEQNCIGDSFVWEEGKTYTLVIEGGTLFTDISAQDGYKTVIRRGNQNVTSIQPKDGDNFTVGFEKVQYYVSLSTKSFDSNYFMYSDALEGTYSRVPSGNTLSGELNKEIYIAFHLGSSKFKGWLTAEGGDEISDFGAGAFVEGVNFWSDRDIDGTGKHFVVCKYVFGKNNATSVYADNVSLWNVTVNKNFTSEVGDAYVYSVNNDRVLGNPSSVNVENGSKVAVYVKVAPNYSLDFTQFDCSDYTERVETVGDDVYTVYLLEFDGITQFTGINLHIGRSPVVPTLTVNNSKYGTVTAKNANLQLYVGDQITVQASANSGYRFSHWQVTTSDGTETVKTSTYVHTIVGADDRLVAVFVSTASETATYTVSLRAGNGIKTVGGEEEFYYNGDNVSIYAETKSGYEFDGWYNAATGAKISSSVNYDFVISSDIVLEARATEKTFTVEIKTVSGGEITCSPLKTEYNLGDRITFTFTAKDGYRFAGWQVNGSDYEAETESFTITISRDISITALAEEIGGGSQTVVPETTFTVDISANDSSYGYVEYTAKKVIRGGSVSMTAYTKGSNYEFKYWVQNNVPVSTERTYLLTDIQDNCVIVAVFAPAERTLACTTTDTEAINLVVSATTGSVGSLQTVTATAKLGYTITEVTVSGLGLNAFADDNGAPVYNAGVWTYTVGGKEYKYYESSQEWVLQIDGKFFAEDLILNNNVSVHIDIDKNGYTVVEWFIALGVTLLLLAFIVAVVLVMRAQPNESVKKIISEMKGEKYKSEMADAAATATVNTASLMGLNGTGIQNPQGGTNPQGPTTAQQLGVQPTQPQQGPRINTFVNGGNASAMRPPMNSQPAKPHDDDDVDNYDPDDDDD